MKKDKAYIVWNKSIKLLTSGKIHSMRENLGIPEFGFETKADLKLWELDCSREFRSIHNDKEIGVDERLGKIANTVYYRYFKYIDEIKKLIPTLAVGFDIALEEYIYYGNVVDATLNECDSSGIEIFVVEKKKTNIVEGVYMRIGPDTSLSDIKEFIDNQGNKIKAHQKEVYGQVPKRYKSEDFSRNNFIYEVGKLPIGDIKRIARRFLSEDDLQGKVSKDILLSKLLLVLKFGSIDSDNIRSILAREQRIRGRV